MRRALAFLLSFAPALAAACPSCARDATPRAGLLIGAFIAAPYGIAVLVVRAIRGADR